LLKHARLISVGLLFDISGDGVVELGALLHLGFDKVGKGHTIQPLGSPFKSRCATTSGISLATENTTLRNATSTQVQFNADTSTKSKFSFVAYSITSSVVTSRQQGSVSTLSNLFPTKTLNLNKLFMMMQTMLKLRS